eukprot:scaffold1232_cov127-Isochrysis_galbana.AAC.5
MALHALPLSSFPIRIAHLFAPSTVGLNGQVPTGIKSHRTQTGLHQLHVLPVKAQSLSMVAVAIHNQATPARVKVARPQTHPCCTKSFTELLRARWVFTTKYGAYGMDAFPFAVPARKPLYRAGTPH